MTRAGKTTTAIVYDADGNLFIKGELSGVKTLMLGDTQITYTPSTATKTTLRTWRTSEGMASGTFGPCDRRLGEKG